MKCAWIEGDDHLERIRVGASWDQIVCGKECRPGSSLCDEHHRLAWRKAKRMTPKEPTAPPSWEESRSGTLKHRSSTSTSMDRAVGAARIHDRQLAARVR